MSDERKPSILDTGNEAMIEAIRKEKPSKFTVGGTYNGTQASGGVTYDRKLANGFGFTAYAKAWMNQKPIVPTDKFGYVVGFEVSKDFNAAKLFVEGPDRSLGRYINGWWNDSAVA